MTATYTIYYKFDAFGSQGGQGRQMRIREKICINNFVKWYLDRFLKI